MTDDHVYTSILFWWKDKHGKHSCICHDRTLDKAMMVATSFGWRPFKWYNPRTWGNGYMTA